MARPRMYKTPEELDDVLEAFFNDEANYPLTITGLALELGFSDKSSIYDYEKIPEFTHSIKRARMRVENSYEKALNKQSTSGAIFALKNFGWSDKTEVEAKDETIKILVERLDGKG